MSKSSIYENAWLNLVFEGKNKAYGAYQLRRENPKTTVYAFFMGLLFVASVSGIGMLLSSFGPKPPMHVLPDNQDSLRLVEVVFPVEPPPIEPPMPPLPMTDTAPTEVTDARDLTADIDIVSTENADDIRKNDDPPARTDDPGSGDNTGSTTSTNTNPAGTHTDVIPADNGRTIATTATVDVMPEFPGGVKKFLQYVADNFEKPEIDQTVTVLMSFVIEKDGSMTDIKVLRNPGYGLDKEAVRVLKSQKMKWKPGIKNGQPIRVLYTLPIKVTRNN